jgi:hypothetical protein
MTRTRIEAALRRRLNRGDHDIAAHPAEPAACAEYVVQPRAVAEAMLASGVFVTLQTGKVIAVLVEQDEPGAGRDVA